MNLQNHSYPVRMASCSALREDPTARPAPLDRHPTLPARAMMMRRKRHTQAPSPAGKSVWTGKTSITSIMDPRTQVKPSPLGHLHG